MAAFHLIPLMCCLRLKRPLSLSNTCVAAAFDLIPLICCGGFLLDNCVVAVFDLISLICCLRLKRPLSLSLSLSHNSGQNFEKRKECPCGRSIGSGGGSSASERTVI